jgi:hypothetical protein
MSYAVQTPAAPAAPPPRRPVTVRLSAVLLVVMALVGLGYAVATLAVTPGVVDRFRDAAGPDPDADGYVTGVWLGAALGAVLAVILFALFVALALGLRRGSNAARIGTWVVCGLGLLFGCATLATVGAQRAGDGTPGTLGFALSTAYPDGWIGLNIGLAVAQVAGYVVVAALLFRAPGAFFGRGSAAGHPSGSSAYVTLPTYGAINTFSPSAQPQATGTSQPPSVPPEPGPDDDYWARPSS